MQYVSSGATPTAALIERIVSIVGWMSFSSLAVSTAICVVILFKPERAAEAGHIDNLIFLFGLVVTAFGLASGLVWRVARWMI